MRFTKIPLIATLMAVALSLLFVLPTLAQQDITDGRQSNGVISVGVFDDITDAQLIKLEVSTFDFSGTGTTAPVPPPYVPVNSQADTDPTNDGVATSFITDTVEGVHAEANDSYLANPVVDPRNTFFRNTLYVSNDPRNDNDDGPGDAATGIDSLTEGAFNTVLINVAHPADALVEDTCVPDADDNPTDKASVTATVRNNRTSQEIDVQLVSANSGAHSQAFFKVVEEGDTIDHDNDSTTDEVEFVQHGGPTWCDTAEERTYDPNPDPAVTGDEQTLEVEETATSAVYNPVNLVNEAKVYNPNESKQLRGAGSPPEQQEIATIFANHGDRLTITVQDASNQDVSGQIELVVDGEGPDFSGISPDDNAVSRPGRLTFGFEVRDDDSGLRHDGESVLSPDDDYEEINPDGDQHLASEPLSTNPGTAVASNGPAADINVNVRENLYFDGDATNDMNAYVDISASGTWEAASSRAGVAYSFSASGADRDDARFLYQLEATDRAGNKSVTDADPDTDTPEPFVFRVDDTEPDLTQVRTGITYDAEDGQETADRSYIALTFNNDALGDIDTEKISVIGHNIVGYVHPGVAPRINRGETLADTPPTGAGVPEEPMTVVTEPTEPTSTNPLTPATETDSTTQTFSDSAVSCSSTNPATAVTTDATNNPVQETDTAICAWTDYNTKKAAYDTYVTENQAYVDYVKNKERYEEENPLLDLDGNTEEGVDPRSRIYIELAEELASDAEPTVLVVGGAVFDLAGLTNESKTVSDSTTPKVEDWIAPKITVTVTGTADDRSVANEDGSFTIDVRSDEDLASRPVVYFVSVTSAAKYEDNDRPTRVTSFEYTIAATPEPQRPSSPLTSEEDENHWGKKYNVDGTLDGFDGLVGVIVFADDEQDNTGATAGWSPGMHREASAPDDGDKLNLEKMDGAGLLVEVDRAFNNGIEEDIGTVTPRSDSAGEETESSNPFVKLSFSKEKGEYSSCPEGLTCKDPVPSAEYADSHSRVTITEITLNDENAMGQLNRVSATEFSLVLRDLEDGDYTVVFTAVDDAGNELEDGEFEFEKVAREPYEIAVSPGWNLVSLPATPLDPGISNVLADNQYISPVLGYQEGDWLTAIREEDGTWRGRLTELTGGYGYWLHARTFETIETMLAEVDPAGTLPTVPVTAGWNLLGVMDIFQNDTGDPPGASDEEGNFPAANSEADNYFSSIPWRVAYSYVTSHSLWVKTVPGADTAAPADTTASDDGFREVSGAGEDVEIVTEEIRNGNGYWVWSPTPSTLVP